ncbi:hypothetical protein [Streptomyces sp. NPDC003401]
MRFAAGVSDRTNVFASVPCRTAEEPFVHLAGRVGAIPGVRAVEAVPALRQVKALACPRDRPAHHVRR